MKLKIIVGSNRKESNSFKIAEKIQSLLTHKKAFSDVSIFDMRSIHLPEWEEECWNSESEKWNQIKQQHITPLTDCDAFIIISPEYSGMVPPILKNFFLLCSRQELAHKPGLIVAVSSGDGGSYPIAELRMSSYKNTRICYIPDHIIIKNVERFLEHSDEQLSSRISYTLDLLGHYSSALKGVRSTAELDYKNFPNGL
jgi:NAD(P)H-dependent FMN reductase